MRISVELAATLRIMVAQACEARRRNIDRNDRVILETICLPFLTEHETTGFDSSELFPKGLALMLEQISWFLRKHAEPLDRKARGVLVRFYLESVLTDALTFVQGLDDEYVMENLPGLWKRLGQIRRLR
ncbi:MAG: hypothetical protein HQM09_15010 [Candidatus Riflebacteria bacterium]|nr:hypothetical protein [Candidatus Riflebacteria bacterium]